MHVDTGRAQRVRGVPEELEGFVVGQPELIGSGIVEQPPQRGPGAGAAAQSEQGLGLGARAEQPLHFDRLAPQPCGLDDERRVRRGVQLQDGPKLPSASFGYVDAQGDTDLGGERSLGFLCPFTQDGHGTGLAPGVRQRSHGERRGRRTDQIIGDRVAELAYQRSRFGDPYRRRTWLWQAVGVRREGGGQGVQRPALGGGAGTHLPGVVTGGGEGGVEAAVGEQPQREASGGPPGGAGGMRRLRIGQGGDSDGDRQRVTLDPAPPDRAAVRQDQLHHLGLKAGGRRTVSGCCPGRLPQQQPPKAGGLTGQEHRRPAGAEQLSHEGGCFLPGQRRCAPRARTRLSYDDSCHSHPPCRLPAPGPAPHSTPPGNVTRWQPRAPA
ncbi:hypothetical protein [Streptomyces spinoverrucosus]|uniref:hypothetical protein n=1 Tax=Streptomyces spinoverrucosus TaxID=284043 RepID=UPI0027D9EB23|nr:hypothetical protein [Streptomyces spinoverrucosus]